MSDKVCKQTSDCFRHAFHLLTAVGCDVLLALESASRFAYIPRRAGSLQRNGHVSFSMHVRIALQCLDLVDTFHIFLPLPSGVHHKSVHALTQDILAVNKVALVSLA